MSTQLDDDELDAALTAFGAPIATDADEIQRELHAGIQERLPGWQPLPTHPMTHLVGALATTTAETRDALVARIRSELLDLLGLLFRIPRGDGTPASSTITVVARDTLGHVAPGPVPVSIGDVDLEVDGDLVVPVGETTVVVPIVAVEFGDEPNGVTGTVEVSALDWLAETDAITLGPPLAGGTAPETDDAYLVRMVRELETTSSAVILPRDFATAARRHPACGFAWAFPHYNADTDDDAAVFHVTTVAAGYDGLELPSAAATAIQADIASRLPDNVVHHLVAPTSVPVSVTTTVARRPGFDPDDVEAAAEALLAGVLDPANYARPRFGDDPNPVPGRVIHENELVARLDAADELDYVVSLQIGDGSSDRVTLGPRQLPRPGSIDVTVVDA